MRESSDSMVTLLLLGWFVVVLGSFDGSQGSIIRQTDHHTNNLTQNAVGSTTYISHSGTPVWLLKPHQVLERVAMRWRVGSSGTRLRLRTLKVSSSVGLTRAPHATMAALATSQNSPCSSVTAPCVKSSCINMLR